MEVNIIPFEKHSGHENMAIDTNLFNDFESCKTTNPILRFYGWSIPCISLGYSQDPEKELYLDKCNKHGIEVVKRPTGGGIVFHNEHEVTYSLVCGKNDPRLPEGLVNSYRFISGVIIEALKSIGVPAELSNTRNNQQARLCFSFPASYEITLKDQKIVGSAQKRGKKALLQQGSIFIGDNVRKTSDFVKNGLDFKPIEDILGIKVDQKELIKALSTGFFSLFC